METLTLRDQFAIAAMQGFAANLGFYLIDEDVARNAYSLADAMLDERSKQVDSDKEPSHG